MAPLQVVLHDPNAVAHQETWLVQDLVPTPSIAILASPPKTGKTVLATVLAVAVATGQPFLGRPVNQGTVLWIAGEENRADRRRVLDQIPYPDGPYPIPATVANHSPSPRAIPIYTCYSGLNVTDDFFRREINELCDMLRPKLIVLDPLISMVARHDLSRDSRVRQAIEALRSISEQFDSTVFALHHSRNARSCANSLQVESAAHSVWMLERSGSRIRIDRRGRGDFANGTIYANSPEFGVYNVDNHAAFAAAGTKAEDVVMDLLDHNPRTAREIAQEAELNLNTVRNALTSLRAQGLAFQCARRGNQPTYQKLDPNSFC